MRLVLEARAEPSRLALWLSPPAAVLATALVGLALFSLLGKDPWSAMHVFFVQPLETRYGIGEWLLKAGPLMLCATGLAVGYRANVWNIGAEGQLTIGGIAAGGVALAFLDASSTWLLPAMIIAGAAGGAAWSAIPAEPGNMKDIWRLAAISSITSLTGSALLALAHADDAFDADAVWAAAHVDEDWQMSQWGQDELALARRDYRRAEFDAAATVLRLTK